jgi:hypothetical protein
VRPDALGGARAIAASPVAGVAHNRDLTSIGRRGLRPDRARELNGADGDVALLGLASLKGTVMQISLSPTRSRSSTGRPPSTAPQAAGVSEPERVRDILPRVSNEIAGHCFSLAPPRTKGQRRTRHVRLSRRILVGLALLSLLLTASGARAQTIRVRDGTSNTLLSVTSGGFLRTTQGAPWALGGVAAGRRRVVSQFHTARRRRTPVTIRNRDGVVRHRRTAPPPWVTGGGISGPGALSCCCRHPCRR